MGFKMVNKMDRIHPLQHICKRFSEDVCRLLLGGDILQMHVRLPEDVIQPSETHPVSAVQMTEGRTFTRGKHLDCSLIVFEELNLDRSTEDGVP